MPFFKRLSRRYEQALERELDDAVLTAAGSGGGGGDGEGVVGVGVDRAAGSALATLSSSVPASLRRRLR